MVFKTHLEMMANKGLFCINYSSATWSCIVRIQMRSEWGNRDGGQVGRAKYVNDNWHFLLFLFLPALFPPCLCLLALGAVHLPFLSLWSFIHHDQSRPKSTRHTPSECQAAGTAVCEHSSISHISSLQQEKAIQNSAFTWGAKMQPSPG